MDLAAGQDRLDGGLSAQVTHPTPPCSSSRTLTVCVCECVSGHLVGPPHHQVGEEGDPADGAQEGDGEELG